MSTDALGQRDLRVPELPIVLQEEIRRMGMPERASARNPVDFGAAIGSLLAEVRVQDSRACPPGALSKTRGLATAMTPLESQMVQELIAEGLRFNTALDDAAAVLAALRDYASRYA